MHLQLAEVFESKNTCHQISDYGLIESSSANTW
jgi:hypothetical protein